MRCVGEWTGPKAACVEPLQLGGALSLWAIRLQNLHHALEAITHHSPRTTRRTPTSNSPLPRRRSPTQLRTHPLSHATRHAHRAHHTKNREITQPHAACRCVPNTNTLCTRPSNPPTAAHTRVHTKENKHTTPPPGIEMEREHIKSHSKEGMIQLGLAARRLLWRRGWAHSSCQPNTGLEAA